jgi:hypothetical protein
MRKIIILAATVAGLGILSTSQSMGAPASGGAILDALKSTSPIQDARVFCYNRHSGRFLHWGHCRRSVPRVYCRNRYTKRFLYWGACRL